MAETCLPTLVWPIYFKSELQPLVVTLATNNAVVSSELTTIWAQIVAPLPHSYTPVTAESAKTLKLYHVFA